LALAAALVIFALGYRVYSAYIARVFEENDANRTPSVELEDGVDYVPTKPLVLFGHHFATIAGAGPIIGPTLAMVFGFIPVWLWLVLGSVFVGAVHDFSALFTSMREKGKSMAEVAEQTLGRAGFLLFIAFTIVMILMVTSVFLKLTAVSLTSMVPLKLMHLSEDQRLLKTVVENGVVKARIGGIASTSAIVITIIAPFIGYLAYRRKTTLAIVAPLAAAACLFSVFVGLKYPVSVSQDTWMYALAIYTLFAAGIPVWIVLQPRDFTNSFLLIVGIITLGLASMAAGFKGVTFTAPAWNVAEGNAKLGLIWPILFITVACGACSGFHALVAGGTSSKQITRESHARKIAYGGMLLEGLLAVGVLIAVGAGYAFKDYMKLVFPTDGSQPNPPAAFAVAMGGLLHKAFGFPGAYGTVFGILLIEGFLATTLDTAVRLNRYLFEELWGVLFRNPPRILRSYVFNAALCVGAMLFLAFSKTVFALWPIFGSANQLLAALTLIAVAAWLAKKGKRYLFAILPAAFMMATTITSLVYLFGRQYLPKRDNLLMGADAALVLLALLVVGLAASVLMKMRRRVPAPQPAEELTPTEV